MVNIEELYDDDLIHILLAVPARTLILRCRNVCNKWKEIIESSAFWNLKCHHMGYVLPNHVQRPLNWKMFVCMPTMKQNLLSNPRAKRGFDLWNLDESGGNGWKVEFLKEPKVMKLGEDKIKKYFVTSHRQCLKSQLIDLRQMGYRNSFIDFMQPEIVISDW
ncbi:F-box only 44 isoform X1 [Pelobates cultripes]|uniref:F-box only 44 isoform X1 n=1 Tax=Pelobates cultripes TaxID=61616 RepID=A0AAD1WST2_PELCU|nr:F-box only 44 isoform X1 [Pelobates cultripes]